MSDWPTWFSALYYGGGVALSVSYLVFFVRTTTQARRRLKNGGGSENQADIASRWAASVTAASVMAYAAVLCLIGLMLLATEGGWRGLWLIALLAVLLIPLRKLAAKQNRIYARFFLGVELPLIPSDEDSEG